MTTQSLSMKTSQPFKAVTKSDLQWFPPCGYFAFICKPQVLPELSASFGDGLLFLKWGECFSLFPSHATSEELTGFHWIHPGECDDE